MSNPKLTIGMPHYDDFDGAWFTVQTIRMFHAEVMDRCEIVIIDNNPTSGHGKHLKEFTTSWAHEHVRYIAAGEVIGSAAAKDRLFREAKGEAVLCIDCHVLVAPGAIARLLEHYESQPETNDLFSGPLVYDNLAGYATHFDDVWRGEMWGTWASDERGEDPDAPPFEIPAQGAGVISCRKDAWPGFNPHMSGFGGEEWYLHEKVRKRGDKCICLPFLRWVHRFCRPHGVPYPLLRRDKVRNYIVGHRELGLDLSRCRAHFVDEVGMPVEEWDQIAAEVKTIPELQNIAPKKPKPCNGCGNNGDVRSLGQLFEKAWQEPSDMNEHCETLRDLASQCEVVADMGSRPLVSTVALLAGEPKKLIACHATEEAVKQVMGVAKRSSELQAAIQQADSLSVTLPDNVVDLLLLDSEPHTAEHVLAELERHAPKVKRWIVLHDTATYGETGSDGGPGVLVGIRQYVRANPQWTVMSHTPRNHGLTVLTCDNRDKSEMPGTIEMAANLAAAAAKHVIDSLKKASQETLENRLEVCTLCKQRVAMRCSVCGCHLVAKARWKSSECPLGLWWSEPEGE